MHYSENMAVQDSDLRKGHLLPMYIWKTISEVKKMQSFNF